MAERSVRVRVHSHPSPGLVDLVRTLAEPAPHDHRRLTPTQHAIEAIARLTATGAVLGLHCAGQLVVEAVNVARAAHAVTHLLRNR